MVKFKRAPTSVGFTYDGAGRRSTLTLPNGIVLTYGYDDANRLRSLSYQKGTTVVGDLSYTYDAAGRRNAVGGSLARTGLPVAVASASYDAANRLSAWGGKTLSYDANGNLSGDGTYTYTWDERNRLSKIASGASTVASFAYDPFGRRTAKMMGSATTRFLYDGIDPVQELNATAPTANLLTGLGVDEVFARTDTSGTSSFLTDALGSSVGLADSTGVVKTSYTYEPYGQVSVSGQASGNSFQYTGRENDGTGLYYYRARYYHPGMQRFISEDPIGFAGGVNLYSYVGGNPMSYIDPKGTQIVIPVPPPPGWPGTPKPPESTPTIEIPGFPPSSGPPPQESRGGGGICEKALEICLKGANACGPVNLPAKGICWALYFGCKAATGPHEPPPTWPSP